MKHTLINRELGLTAQVEGDFFFNADGTIHYVWSCKACDIYENGAFLSDVTMTNDSPGYIKKYLRGFVRKEVK